jgi:prepilin-type N-terminal cleavage/methylation domain-containing protein
MSTTFKKSLSQKEHGFTLIELIIVVVIVAILALVAIPKYYASVGKTQKNQVYANLAAIRQAMLSYYAVYGAYPGYNVFPITVVVDGETIMNLSNLSNDNWTYGHMNEGCGGTTNRSCEYAHKQPGSTCYYAEFTDTGGHYGDCRP